MPQSAARNDRPIVAQRVDACEVARATQLLEVFVCLSESFATRAMAGTAQTAQD